LKMRGYTKQGEYEVKTVNITGKQSMKPEIDVVYELEVDMPALAYLTKEETNEIFRDGRHCAPWGERAFAKIFGWDRVDAKGYDFVLPDGRKVDAKNMTKHGLRFSASHMIGAGRKFVKEEHEKHANSIGFLCIDIVNFPKIRAVWKNGTTMVKQYPSGDVSTARREELFGVE
jgi:hypothetical protein